ncbi:MAG: galactose-1-phosphate uridylyltransferase, partial [Eubacteriales bacterium]|nr:galactose-1-phosphate uridylyltransferase [Eubacteriales bacterium]
MPMRAIDELVAYALEKGLVEPEDAVYTRNRLLETLGLTTYQPGGAEGVLRPLPELLEELLDDACRRGVLEPTQANRDLFDTKLMGCLTPRPSWVIERFRQAYAQSPDAAADWFYAFCQDCNYIRRDRIAKDMRWIAPTPYGDFDITINLSKPEKDPRDIAAAKLRPQGGYPACQLCVENEGYQGRLDHPARQNHRILPLNLGDEEWGFQYSPYVYYNEHCIVLNQRHVPMTIEPRTFEKLFQFVAQFPSYFVGSNADLPIVGGSILTHEHFQGGRYTFAMAKAPADRSFHVKGFEDVEG